MCWGSAKASQKVAYNLSDSESFDIRCFLFAAFIIKYCKWLSVVKNVIKMKNVSQLTFDWKKLRQFSIARWPKEMGTTHGIEHWDRVAKFGEMLYVDSVDMNVVVAFAYLHDAERINNYIDDMHGQRASMLVDSIRHNYLRDFNDEQVSLLKRACELHTLKHRTGNITIDTCFDADRLDLPRVGITPEPERMATSQGAKIASNPFYIRFYDETISAWSDKNGLI